MMMMRTDYFEKSRKIEEKKLKLITLVGRVRFMCSLFKKKKKRLEIDLKDYFFITSHLSHTKIEKKRKQITMMQFEFFLANFTAF